MAEISIPFDKKLIPPLLSGTKTVTSRSKPYGTAGDQFVVEGKRFELTNIVRMPLGVVYDRLWEPSGAEDGFDFIKIYNRLHPGKPYDPFREVYVHFFKEVGA